MPNAPAQTWSLLSEIFWRRFCV